MVPGDRDLSFVDVVPTRRADRGLRPKRDGQCLGRIHGGRKDRGAPDQRLPGRHCAADGWVRCRTGTVRPGDRRATGYILPLREQGIRDHHVRDKESKRGNAQGHSDHIVRPLRDRRRIDGLVQTQHEIHPVIARWQGRITQIQVRIRRKGSIRILAPGHGDRAGRPDVHAAVFVVRVKDPLRVESVQNVRLIDHAIGRAKVHVYRGIVLHRGHKDRRAVDRGCNLARARRPAQVVFFGQGIGRHQAVPPVKAIALCIRGPDSPKLGIRTQIDPRSLRDRTPCPIGVGEGAAGWDDKGARTGAVLIVDRDRRSVWIVEVEIGSPVRIPSVRARRESPDRVIVLGVPQVIGHCAVSPHL